MQPVEGDNAYEALAPPRCNVDGGQTMFVRYSRATGAYSTEVRLDPSSCPIRSDVGF